MTMTTPTSYRRTVTASFVGYVSQAVINNFMPLLFVTFATTLGIDLARLSALITVNFVTQLTVDVLAARYVDRVGYRPAILAAHAAAAAGLLVLGILPTRVGDPYPALLAAVILYAIGGGLIEVMVSPIVQACPSPHKAKRMSLLHSFYCWGQLGTVLASTAFFWAFGIARWPLLACLWALVPAAGLALFASAPMPPIVPEGTGQIPARRLLRLPAFRIFALMMLCAGAAELAMSQWASAFAESGLGVSKTVGDLAGPAAFALAMGLARSLYASLGHRLPLRPFMAGSAALGVVAYLLASLGPTPAVGLVGCALAGLAVGIMWPGTLSLAAEALPGGGTPMFALFAVAGDLGCAIGPALVGLVAQLSGGTLQAGLLAAAAFPLALLACTAMARGGAPARA